MNNNTQASNRIQSLELMRLLQPFTQTGVMTTDEATNIISLFIKGDTKRASFHEVYTRHFIRFMEWLTGIFIRRKK